MRFSLESIRQKSFYINSTDILGIDELDKSRIRIKKEHGFEFNEKTGLFKILSKVDYVQVENENESFLFGTSIISAFQFEDFDDLISISKDNEIDMPDNLIINLISIVYSTIRGILFSLTQKTEYEDMYLPLTNPDEIRHSLPNTK